MIQKLKTKFNIVSIDKNSDKTNPKTSLHKDLSDIKKEKDTLNQSKQNLMQKLLGQYKSPSYDDSEETRNICEESSNNDKNHIKNDLDHTVQKREIKSEKDRFGNENSIVSDINNVFENHNYKDM